jgi:hypothetical protein
VTRRPGTTRSSAESAADRLLEHAKLVREHQTAQLIDRAKRLSELERVHRRSARHGRAGVDEEREIREREWELILRDGARQEKSAVRVLKRQRERLREAVRTVVDHRERFEYKKGNPNTSICLWKSSAPASAALTPQSFNDGVVRVLSAASAGTIRTGQNTVSLTAEVKGAIAHDTHWNAVAALDIVTSHFFRATVPHDGILSVTGTYAPLGTVFLGAPGDLLFAPSAGSDMVIYLDVLVEAADGAFIHLPLGPTQSVFNRSVGPSLGGQTALVSVGAAHSVAHQLAHENLMEVHAGDIVHVTAGFDLYIAGSLRGTARATFAPLPLAFNVPMVLVRVTG